MTNTLTLLDDTFMARLAGGAFKGGLFSADPADSRQPSGSASHMIGPCPNPDAFPKPAPNPDPFPVQPFPFHGGAN